MITTDSECIYIEGAREHNLKNITIAVPRNKLVVLTGLSGSGKSSLAFDTIFAEGQRRYLETFSAYARNFLGALKRPDVDRISGLSPVIAIEQKTVSSNPRSTVGTITEIYDFLRLLYARIAIPDSPVTGKPMQRYTNQQIKDLLCETYKNQYITLLAPVVRSRKGHYRELFESYRKKGFLKARIDGQIVELNAGLALDRYKVHDIEIVIDRLDVTTRNNNRVFQSLDTALKMGTGTILVLPDNSNVCRYFSLHWMCADSGISYDAPSPNVFSFNSPYGCCTSCEGLGYTSDWNIDKIFPDKNKSLQDGGLVFFNSKSKYPKAVIPELDLFLKSEGFSWSSNVKQFSNTFKMQLLHGNSKSFKGILSYWDILVDDSEEDDMWSHLKHQRSCITCNGSRLKPEALLYKIHHKSIHELSCMDFEELQQWIKNTPAALDKFSKTVATELFKELEQRIGFLMDVGLDYLQLHLSSQTLSGGESQRIRLASQIGSKLVGVLYILDEPSIGLHPRDNKKLIQSLKQLRDIGNTVLVVEHDREMMLESDYIIDIGPGAGIHGGHVISSGSIKDLLRTQSLTAQYLNQHLKVANITSKTSISKSKSIRLKGCRGLNLKDIDVTFPLGCFIGVTGLSGSGKSTLINETLYPILAQHCHNAEHEPQMYQSVSGLEWVDKVINVDQKPIGRTPRSNPATYTGVFTDIRNLFAALPEAKVLGFNPGRFSFNVKGGRCEACGGAGVNVIEMKFLPDVLVGCTVCRGKRYVKDTLQVKYKGKSIADILDATISEAAHIFEAQPHIYNKLNALVAVGLGYVKLGQPATTLSGGEAQRIKLASELARKSTGKTVYILDEPSTGLHFEDIRQLLTVLYRFIETGNTVIVIEHNTDIIAAADYIIDLGPEGGKRGGYILFEGVLTDLLKLKNNPTAVALKSDFKGF